MKLETRTLQILKNFSTINQQIVIRPGNIVRTIDEGKKTLGRATLPQSFDKQVSIYELSRFFGALSLFKDPEIEIGDNQLTISADGRKLNYTFADPAHMLLPADKDPKLPSVDVSFVLPEGALQDILKAAGVLGMPEVSISGDGSKIRLKVLNTKNPSTDDYSIEVGESDKVFNMIMKADNIKMLPGEYQVDICFKKIALFKGQDVEYFIAFDETSSAG